MQQESNFSDTDQQVIKYLSEEGIVQQSTSSDISIRGQTVMIGIYGTLIYTPIHLDRLLYEPGSYHLICC